MLTGLGIDHGVDLDAVVATSVWMAGRLGRPIRRPWSVPSARRRGPDPGSGSGRRRPRWHNRRMSPTVYLHIGAPKTGTTYLQDRLSLNASLLADHDVHFPSGSPS